MFYLWLWVVMFVLVCSVGAIGTFLQSQLRRRCFGSSEGHLIPEDNGGYLSSAPTMGIGPFTPSPPPYSVVPPRPKGYKAIVGSQIYESAKQDSDKTPPPTYSQIYMRGDDSGEQETSLT